MTRSFVDPLPRGLVPWALLTAQLAACGGQVVGWPAPDDVAPFVTATLPVDLATEQPRFAPIIATFSEVIDPASIDDTTFFLTSDVGRVPATVVYAGGRALLVPDAELDADARYEMTATVGVADLAGNTMVDDYIWSFTTTSALDMTPPRVILTMPRDGASSVAVGGPILATFSEAMASSSLNLATLTLFGPGDVPVAGDVTYDMAGPTAAFTPLADLASDTTYTATVDGSVTDLAGNHMDGDYVWTFTTASPVDRTAPYVVLTSPEDGATAVAGDDLVLMLFSELMDVATLTEANIEITGPGGAVVAGTIASDAATPYVLFHPTVDLVADATYTGRVRVGVTDLAGNHLADPYLWSFQVRPALDTTPPTVILTNPVSDEADVVSGVVLYAAFSEPMAAATLTTTSFQVTGPGGAPLASSVVYNGLTPIALLMPDTSLLPDVTYTARVTTDATDLAGNHLAADYTWSFTVAGLDVTPPEVTLTAPLEGATDAPLGGDVVAAFSEAMDPATLTELTFRLRGPGNQPVPGVVSRGVVVPVAVFVPDAQLLPGTLYIATVTADATDLAGNHLAHDYAWTFRTLSNDTTRPVVVLTNPADLADGVPPNLDVVAAFSEPMDASTVTDATFVVTDAADVIVPGAVSLAGAVATFLPDADLASGAVYTATITAAATDLAGNHLAADYAWMFRVQLPGDSVPPQVTLTFPDDGASDVAVDEDLLVAFSEPMSVSTVSVTSFVVTGPGGAAVSGFVSYDLMVPIATFNPDGALIPGAVYTATVTTEATDLAGNPLVADYVWSFTAAAAVDTTAPFVVLTNPDDGDTDVRRAAAVLAVFDEPMDPGSFDGSTVVVGCPAAVPGVVTYDAVTRVVTFTADNLLPTDATCTATVSGAADLAGNPMLAPYVWSFSTGAVPDDVAPFVIVTQPEDLAVNVPLGGVLTVVFSEPMRAASLTASSITLVDGALLPVAGVVSYDGLLPIATFDPDADLVGGMTYTATVTTDARDAAGNPMLADEVWTFTTVVAPDTGAPFVVLTTPVDTARDVLVGASVEALFSEAMDVATFDASTFRLTAPGNVPVSGTVGLDTWSPVATFTPDADLMMGTTYTATIDAGVADLAGNMLGMDYVWTFTTAANPFALDPINLRSLSTFVAVAGAGLTNSNSSGVTTLNGDVGLSPTATCMGDGAPCTLTNPVINGTFYANDPEGIAAQAKVDLTAAYVDGMSRPVGTTVNDLSELILPPGVYTSGSTMSVAVGGTVYLDGQGDPNAVWIFQVGSSLTVNNNAQILLLNGARAKNVFWTVFASSTLGSNVSFQGSVLAGASNSVGTDSVVVGRLLCITGQITLLSNNVTLPPL